MDSHCAAYADVHSRKHVTGVHLQSVIFAAVASHLIDARGTVEPNIDPRGLADRLASNVFFWLDLVNPTAAELHQLAETFSLHPLAVEDSQKFHQRPKIEDYDDFTFLVVFGSRSDPSRRAGLAPVEVHCFFAPHWLITIHTGECAVFDELRERHAKRLLKFEEGLGILYLVLDSLVDSFFPALSDLDDSIDQLEDDILDDAQPEQLQQAMGMKRQLVQLRKIVHPQRDMFGALLSGRYELPGMDAEHEHYFRDIYDHLIRLSEQIDDYRDLASGTTDLYQSTIGNKMNLTMKQLGWVATFFLPLSFLTGFFGQNFNLLVGKIISPGWTFWVLGIGLDVTAFLAVLTWYVSRERGNLLLRRRRLPPRAGQGGAAR
ncbi:MAG: magnesium transporter [Actinomycetota bacterium]|jgi:magnesium transporter